MVIRNKFWSFSDLINDMESRAISWAVRQIPSLIAQSILPAAPEKVEEKMDEEDIKRKLFGSFASHK